MNEHEKIIRARAAQAEDWPECIDDCINIGAAGPAYPYRGPRLWWVEHDESCPRFGTCDLAGLDLGL